MEQDITVIFGLTLHVFFLPFCPASLTESCVERSPRPAQVSRQSCLWPLKLMDVTNGKSDRV